jgi:hypothetical protein
MVHLDACQIVEAFQKLEFFGDFAFVIENRVRPFSFAQFFLGENFALKLML